MIRLVSAALSGALFVTALFAATPALAAGTNFNGTVALSNCSGAVVRWSSSVPSDKAMMLTNGHCYQLMGTHQVIVNQPSVRDVSLLHSNGSSAGDVSTTTLLYATMWKTDVALYQLPLSYRQIRNVYGVQAITLAAAQPQPKDEPISI